MTLAQQQVGRGPRWGRTAGIWHGRGMGDMHHKEDGERGRDGPQSCSGQVNMNEGLTMNPCICGYARKHVSKQKHESVMVSSPRNTSVVHLSAFKSTSVGSVFALAELAVGAIIHQICRVPGHVTGSSCSKSLLGYVEIYGCPSLMKMD